jgi:hypothetical protein
VQRDDIDAARHDDLAARTSGREMPPESRVPGPLALMIGSIP